MTGYILRHEAHFRAVMEEQLRLESSEQIRIRRKRLERNENRIAELKRLFIRIYEDNACGRLSDERFDMLSLTYETEQKQLETECVTLRQEIEVQERQNENVEKFIQTAHKYVGIDKLDGYALRELVSAIYVDQMQHELRRMMLMAQGNVEASFRSVLNRDENELAEVEKTEEYIDFLNKEISLHVSRLIAYETNEKASAVVSSFFTISGNIERIGDHADNLAGYTRLLNKRNISFSPAAQKEIAAMRDICLECVDYLLTPVAGNVEWLSEVSALEQRIDDMTSDYRRSHLERMRSGECSDEACIIYSELLTDFERIGDHVLNIAQEMAQVQEHI